MALTKLDDRLPAGRPLRRNDVVAETKNSFWTPYGRVNRVIDEDTVEVAWGKDGIRLEQSDSLIVQNHYRGYWDRGRSEVHPDFSGSPVPPALFRRMPSLRRLKQMAISWGRGAWARDREHFEAEMAAQQAEWDAEDEAEAAAEPGRTASRLAITA